MSAPISLLESVEEFKNKAWLQTLESIDIDDTKYREYQLNVMEDIEKMFLAGAKDIGVIIPTGAGKSHVMGTLQLRLKIIRFAVLCHYNAINESNSEFFRKSSASPTEKIVECGYITNTELAAMLPNNNDFVSVDTHATLKTENTPYLVFAGINRFLKDVKYKNKFEIIAIDEPQLSMSAVNKMRQQNPNAVILYFTAFPPTELLELCGQNVIEVLHKDIRHQLKEQHMATVSSVDHFDRNQHDESDLKETAWLNKNFYNHHKIWKMNLDKAVNRLGDVANGAGMIVKCANVADCIEVAKILNEDAMFKHKNLKARAIAGKLANPKYVKKARADYISGRIHVLVVCKMLAVGFHDTRTKVLVPLYATKNFQEFLQFFGRSTSKKTRRTDAYMVAMDLFWECNNFKHLYSQYCRTGVVNLLESDSYIDLEADANPDDNPDTDDNEKITIRNREREYFTYPAPIPSANILVSCRPVYDHQDEQIQTLPPAYFAPVTLPTLPSRRRTLHQMLDHDDEHDVLSVDNKRPRTSSDLQQTSASSPVDVIPEPTAPQMKAILHLLKSRPNEVMTIPMIIDGLIATDKWIIYPKGIDKDDTPIAQDYQFVIEHASVNKLRGRVASRVSAMVKEQKYALRSTPRLGKVCMTVVYVPRD